MLMASRALAETKRFKDEPRLLDNGYSRLWLRPDGSVLDKRVNQYELSYGKPPPTLGPVKKLSIGLFHAVALLRDGTVRAWATTNDTEAVPTSVTDVPPGLSDVIDVAAGNNITVAVRRDGSVVGWGERWFIAGDGSATKSPFILPNGLTDIRSVFAGQEDQSGWAATRLDGSLASWDLAGNPRPMPSLKDVVKLASGGVEIAFLRINGTVATWNRADQQVNPVPNGDRIIDVAEGNHHALALKRDGTVIAWNCASCGSGNEAGQATVPAGLSDVVAIAVNSNTSYALKEDGTVVQWGWGVGDSWYGDP